MNAIRKRNLPNMPLSQYSGYGEEEDDDSNRDGNSHGLLEINTRKIKRKRKSSMNISESKTNKVEEQDDNKEHPSL